MNKRTIAQTPAPKKDRVHGSDLNKSNTSKDLSSAKLIKFDEKTLVAIKNKVIDCENSSILWGLSLKKLKAFIKSSLSFSKRTIPFESLYT